VKTRYILAIAAATLMVVSLATAQTSKAQPAKPAPKPVVSGSSRTTSQKDDPNKRNDDGSTPLQWAVYRGDVPAVKRLLRMGANLKHWSFVTGRPADVERMADQLRLFKADGRRPDDHATSLWLTDREGRLMQRYPGNPPDRTRLISELTQLQTLTLPR